MARPIILSNGSMHVGLNLYGEVHDFYYPYVGLENHAAAKSLRHRVGVWVAGRFSWLDDGAWQFIYDYHDNTLVGFMKAIHPELGVTLEFDDAIDATNDIFLRNIHVINNSDETREIRLFMHQVFDIGDGAGNGDTVQYLPESDAIIHYRGRRFFAIGGLHARTKKVFDQYSVGLFGIEGHQGTYADAEDGELSRNNVEHGRVDSVIGFNISLEAHSSSRVDYWIAAGLTDSEALENDRLVREEGVLHRLLLTTEWWHQWIKPASAHANKLPKQWQESFIKNVLLIKAHIDKRGSVLASTDTTMLKYSRDAYGYCWTRDAAYAIWPLIRLGYIEEPLAFFSFCKRVLNPDGYLMHKYQPDAALGSSWHPYLHDDGTIAPPIQEDETAIVLYIFAEYYKQHQDKQLLNDYYDDFIKVMADFLSAYIDKNNGLPNTSYDLWEERYLTTTYTTAVVYASLLAATELAEAMNDAKHAVRWRSAADDIAVNARSYLYNTNRQVFYKGFRVIEGKMQYDEAVDASAVFGAYMYGLFHEDDVEIKDSVQTLRNSLKMPMSDNLGIARYENDNYDRVNQDITGNPWFVTSFWLAQYYLGIGEIEEAKRIIEWSRSYMMNTGVLSEQINPYTGQYVSVAPLCWSQAEYVSTLLDFMGS